jgi:hypothetical protein
MKKLLLLPLLLAATCQAAEDKPGPSVVNPEPEEKDFTVHHKASALSMKEWKKKVLESFNRTAQKKLGPHN